LRARARSAPRALVPCALRALAFAACLMMLLPPIAEGRQAGEPAAGAQASVVVRWPGRAGVRRYRLQFATDEKFSDIVFDRAVEGRQFTVTELPPGVYFWRVAPAAAETSAFSKPERVTVKAPSSPPVSADAGTRTGRGVNTGSPHITPDEASGWRTATGEVSRLAAARLRPGGVTDIVGVTAAGRVFAVDGASGVSLWNARAEPDAPAGFAPVVVAAAGGGAGVLAGADGGVRLLRGDTGREVWRARLEGTAAVGAFADLDGDGAGELLVVTSRAPALHVLALDTGRVINSIKLDAEAVGAPLPFATASARGVLLALADGTVQARGRDLAPTASLKLDTVPTTAPVMISRGDIMVVVVGSEIGLVALGFPEMKVLGRIVSDNDPVRGTLVSADVDGDGSAEIAMVTRGGRLALVGTRDGTVRWFAEGAGASDGASLADLDGDGVLDLIAAGGSAFLLGFSGRDGSLLMRADEPGAAAKSPRVRPVAVVHSPGGGLLLVGADTAGTGLRAVELPAGSGRVRRP
ncbi:MAG TPA: PQQ-binding-like beta-propeller repeat protein, partial [Pyrinomonadaceae bacterium]|nr:PQQ-binding-like beta-propeller repeat protein [Pyrinomonadaceae bacterium]